MYDRVRVPSRVCLQVNEQAALKQLGGLRDQIAHQAAALEQATERLEQLERSLEAQVAVNRQLMHKKEDVEWQLMAAMAKVSGGREL